MARIQIPERERPRIKRFLKADPSTRTAIADALRVCPRALGQEALVDGAMNSLRVSHPDVDQAAARDIIAFLVGLYWLRADMNVPGETIAAELRSSAESSNDPELANPARGWNEEEKTLAKLLSVDETLGVATKALFLAYQAPRHLHHARILTDARPVFPSVSSAKSGPSAFMILHTLQMEIHENGEDHEWFVALDDDDLVNLRNAIDRAIEKNEALAATLRKTGVAVLNWKEAKDARITD